MIQSTDDTAIVEYKARNNGAKVEGVKLIHCIDGDEVKCLESDPRIQRAEIVKIDRKKVINAIQKINYRL